MSTESTRKLFDRYMEAISKGDKSQEVVDQFISDESLKEHIAVFESAFPGYTLAPEDIIIEDDKIVLRANFRGVQRGEFHGLSPTGAEVSTPIVVIYRVKDDKIVEHWLSADMLSVMQQLGAAPAPA